MASFAGLGFKRVGDKLHGGPGLDSLFVSNTDSPGKYIFAQVGIMGSILMTKAVCWVTPSKVMVVRSFEVVAAYVLQVRITK